MQSFIQKHLHHQNSIPVFLAAVITDMFSRQTFDTLDDPTSSPPAEDEEVQPEMEEYHVEEPEVVVENEEEMVEEEELVEEEIVEDEEEDEDVDEEEEVGESGDDDNAGDSDASSDIVCID